MWPRAPSSRVVTTRSGGLGKPHHGGTAASSIATPPLTVIPLSPTTASTPPSHPPAPATRGRAPIAPGTPPRTGRQYPPTSRRSGLSNPSRPQRNIEPLTRLAVDRSLVPPGSRGRDGTKERNIEKQWSPRWRQRRYPMILGRCSRQRRSQEAMKLTDDCTMPSGPQLTQRWRRGGRHRHWRRLRRVHHTSGGVLCTSRLAAKSSRRCSGQVTFDSNYVRRAKEEEAWSSEVSMAVALDESPREGNE